MYPDFQYLLEALFGTAMPSWLSVFKTFGFFVAIAFLAAARVLTSELKRKEKQGLLKPVLKTVKEKVKSADGGPDTTITKQVLFYPHQLITEIVFAAAIGGIIGAKVFNALETWNDFIQDPIGNFFSRSGLTFYGGFIVATIVLYYYARKYKIAFKHLCDAAAPAIMLAYGIGRLGCHFSGDGDWGIYNSAYVTQTDATAALKLVQPADSTMVASLLVRQNADKTYYTEPHAYFPAPSGVPRWLVAMNYPHNVGYEGMIIPESKGEYRTVLPVGVFPTPIYEATLGILLFAGMWAVRRRLRYPLHMFALYLVLAGIERFFVELIRVNTTYDLGFMKPTQAEIISVALFLTGTGIFLFYRPKQTTLSEPPATTE